MDVIITLKARLILYYKGKILLLKQTKPNGGNYTLVGGRIENSEFAKDCLIRECKEEAGLILRKKDLKLAHVLHKKNEKEHRITFYFKTFFWNGNPSAREKHKFESVEWFSLDKLPKNMTKTVQHVLEQYRLGNYYSELKKK